MDARPLSIDVIAMKFSSDVLSYMRNWMRVSYGEDIEFHKYRMRLLTSLSGANNTTEKLLMLVAKVETKLKFDITEIVSDKVMGESIAKYVFSKIMLAMNEEHRKILEHELDRVKSETCVLLEKSSGLKTKIGQH